MLSIKWNKNLHSIANVKSENYRLALRKELNYKKY